MMFSVVIPLYNKQESILQTVESVLQQSYPHFELIIVDDGSTDNSLKVLETISDDRLVIVKKKNGGVSSARNAGIDAAKHDLVALLDGDDIWHRDILLQMHKATQLLPDAAMFGARHDKVTSQEQLKVTKAVSSERIEYVDNYFAHALNDYMFHSSSVVLRKSRVQDRFDETLSSGEDLDLWFRIAAKYKVGYIYETLSFYRLNSENRALHREFPLQKHLVSKIYGNLSAYFANPAIQSFVTDYILINLRPFYFNSKDRRMAEAQFQLIEQYAPFKKKAIYRLPYGVAKLLYKVVKQLKPAKTI
jgi:glycosyltransferase involved in cell wall biosynthesis